MPRGSSRIRPVAFIDPPSTAAPLKNWQRFLSSMQSLPQDDEHFRGLTKWAQAVVDWKIAGEQGPAPQQGRKPGRPPQAPKVKQPT